MTDADKPLFPILTTGFNECAKLRRYAMAFEFKVENFLRSKRIDFNR
jgi:hypothetical protein